jgi:hypothetical protein
MARTTDEVKKRCQQMNHFAETVKKGGMVAGCLNHNGEFDGKLDARPQYDLMLEHLDRSLVKMQFQVAAITSGFTTASQSLVGMPLLTACRPWGGLLTK